MAPCAAQLGAFLGAARSRHCPGRNGGASAGARMQGRGHGGRGRRGPHHMAALRSIAAPRNRPDASVISGGHSTAASRVITMDTVPAATASCSKTIPRRLMPWQVRAWGGGWGRGRARVGSPAGSAGGAAVQAAQRPRWQSGSSGAAARVEKHGAAPSRRPLPRRPHDHPPPVPGSRTWKVYASCLRSLPGASTRAKLAAPNRRSPATSRLSSQLEKSPTVTPLNKTVGASSTSTP